MKAEILEELSRDAFVPHPRLRNGHLQTIAGSLISRRTPLTDSMSARRFFETDDGTRIAAECAWQPDPRSRPTLILCHGLEGSAWSGYMMGTSEKALEAGFNSIRLNTRGCGGTEHLTQTLYHAGLTGDVRQVVAELIERDGLERIYVAGFSLGGNVVLKLAGEYGHNAPAQLRGVVAVSPSIDLEACCRAIELKSNFLYHARFMISLRNSIRRKARLFPRRYDASLLKNAWSIRRFDDVFTAPQAGFRDAADYYSRASALQLIGKIGVPAFIIQAKDDPVIPFQPFESPEVTSNPNVLLLASDNGGHVSFIQTGQSGEARFWAESKVIEFIRLLGRRVIPEID